MSFSTQLPLLLFFSSLFIHVSLGEVVCEELANEACAFSIASSGKRCLLETARAADGGGVEYQCRTSEVVVERMGDYIETDECVEACGVDRKFVGISSDAFLEPQFSAKLCSPPCYQKCPNIVDLYFNLAAGEGVLLPELCEKQRMNPGRAMFELLISSGAAAPSPFSGFSEDIKSAPAPAPL
ncbi:hypothetical protein PIB30_041480 [Stylosanthes scabra]|uniref:PAR1 protein n=1 Tax=Stylosanthes scabra TaxID=79078 RepID=A0ABU6SET0_9FABA|nr:hypothetical protein [Stylosanthes scabra]